MRSFPSFLQSCNCTYTPYTYVPNGNGQHCTVSHERLLCSSTRGFPYPLFSPKLLSGFVVTSISRKTDQVTEKRKRDQTAFYRVLVDIAPAHHDSAVEANATKSQSWRLVPNAMRRTVHTVYVNMPYTQARRHALAYFWTCLLSSFALFCVYLLQMRMLRMACLEFTPFCLCEFRWTIQFPQA